MSGSARPAPSVYQTSYALANEALQKALHDVVESGADCENGVPWRASAALHALLRTHRVDRRGRCRACRRPGVLPWRARCRVHVEACYWLHQPGDFLLSQAAAELGAGRRR